MLRSSRKGLFSFALATLATAALVAGCGEPAPLLIGVLVPDTGVASTYARGIRNGVELAVEEVNAAGGVLGGRMLAVEFRDTGTRPDTAVVAARDLIEAQGAFALIGPVSSSVALALVPVATETKTIILSPAASAPQLTKDGGEYFFRNYPSDVVEGQAMAEFCRQLALSAVAVLHSDDIFGVGISDVFVQKFEAATRSVVFRENFSSGISDAQALEIARRADASKAQAIYIAAYQSDTAVLLKALAQVGSTKARLATSATTREIARAVGTAAEGLVFPQSSFDPNDKSESVQKFVNAYKAKFAAQGGPELPDNYAAHAYDAVHVLAKAIDTAQLRDKINAALWNINHPGVTGRIDFDLNGDVIKAPRFFAILAGEVVTYEAFRDAKVGQSVLAGDR